MGLAKKLIEQIGMIDLHCIKEFPNERMPLLEYPAVMVGTKLEKLTPCALDNYLGSYGDEACVAALMEEEIFLHVYSPYLWGGRYCDTTTDRVMGVVLNNLHEHSFKEIRRKQSYYDPKTDCYRGEITVMVTSWVRLEEE